MNAAEGMAAIASVLVEQDTRTVAEKLESLKVGDVIVFGVDRHACKAGVEYEVRSIQRVSKCRFDLALLEVGKPMTELIPGKYLAAGKMFKQSNLIHATWYANAKNYGAFAVVND